MGFGCGVWSVVCVWGGGGRGEGPTEGLDCWLKRGPTLRITSSIPASMFESFAVLLYLREGAQGEGGQEDGSAGQ